MTQVLRFGRRGRIPGQAVTKFLTARREVESAVALVDLLGVAKATAIGVSAEADGAVHTTAAANAADAVPNTAINR